MGLVVIASCSHRGVLNSVKRAPSISGIQKVHAVVGGFHLVDPTYIVPMRCTGEVFIGEALRVMPEKIIRPYVGNRLTFAAA